MTRIKIACTIETPSGEVLTITQNDLREMAKAMGLRLYKSYTQDESREAADRLKEKMAQIRIAAGNVPAEDIADALNYMRGTWRGQ